MKQESRKTAFSLAVAANVMWASSFVGSKYTLLAWGPYTAVFLRFVLSFAVLAAAYRMSGISLELPSNKRQWSMVLLVGLILGSLYPLQLSGLQYISTSVSAAIMLLAPVILISLGPALTGESLDRQKTLAVILGAIGGIVLLSENLNGTNVNGVGVWLTLGAAVCLAVFTLANKRASISTKHTTVTLYSFAVGSIILAPLAYFESATNVVSTVDLSKSVWALIYLVVACTAIPFFIWNHATAMTETKNLASTMHIKTPVAIILGVIVFGEPITWQLILGTAIVSFALWLSQKNNIYLISKTERGVKTYEREPISSAAFRKIH